MFDVQCCMTKDAVAQVTICSDVVATLAQTLFQRRSGIKVGKACYIDADWPGEPGVTFGDGAIADRRSIIFGHLLSFNGQDNLLKYGPVSIGAGAHISPRAAIMPNVNVGAGEMVLAGELRMK